MDIRLDLKNVFKLPGYTESGKPLTQEAVKAAIIRGLKENGLHSDSVKVFMKYDF